MIVAGVDYSMSSPAVCVYDTNKPLAFEHLKFFNINDRKKTALNTPSLVIELHEPWTTPEERYDNLSSRVMGFIETNGVEEVFLEGYSMGSSSGMVFNIAENTGSLKQKLYKRGIKITSSSPSSVKKKFHGKGNAKKDQMCEVFYALFGVKFHLLYGGKPYDAPENDLVDAYANMIMYQETKS